MDTYSFFFNGENGTPKWVKFWCYDNLGRKSQKLQLLLKFKPKKGTSSNCLLLLSVHSSFKNILLPFWHICELILPMNFCINSWWHFFRPILNLLISIHNWSQPQVPDGYILGHSMRIGIRYQQIRIICSHIFLSIHSQFTFGVHINLNADMEPECNHILGHKSDVNSHSMWANSTKVCPHIVMYIREDFTLISFFL